MNKVDETIEAICDWIQEELINDMYDNSNQIAEMVNALAALVCASKKERRNRLER